MLHLLTAELAQAAYHHDTTLLTSRIFSVSFSSANFYLAVSVLIPIPDNGDNYVLGGNGGGVGGDSIPWMLVYRGRQGGVGWAICHPGGCLGGQRAARNVAK